MYICGKYIYAISHSNDQLFFAVDFQNITVDVEKIVPRDTSLLEDVPSFSYFSVRKKFYMQRCAKECLVKYLNLTSSEMDDMKIKRLYSKELKF